MNSTELFCSVIIPTIGRASLARSVESAINQVCDQPFEVIVVNDLGRPLPAADWQQSALVRVIDTSHRERSAARNAGAAIARGCYYNFLDDDDWLLPGALQALGQVAARSPAAWLYGSTQLTDAGGRCLYQFDHQLNGNCFAHTVAGEWVPLQASLIKASVFWSVGAFDNIYHSAQDKDLLMQVALRHELAGTRTPVVAILRGIWQTSTDWKTTSSNWHAAREKALSQPGAAARMRASVNSAYWHGRWVRSYLLSAAYDLWHGQFILAAGRLGHAAEALLLAGSRLFSGDFWRALLRQHLTVGFAPTDPPTSAVASPAKPGPAG